MALVDQQEAAAAVSEGGGAHGGDGEYIFVYMYQHVFVPLGLHQLTDPKVLEQKLVQLKAANKPFGRTLYRTIVVLCEEEVRSVNSTDVGSADLNP